MQINDISSAISLKSVFSWHGSWNGRDLLVCDSGVGVGGGDNVVVSAPRANWPRPLYNTESLCKSDLNQ